jgi:hypothetical protein
MKVGKNGDKKIRSKWLEIKKRVLFKRYYGSVFILSKRHYGSMFILSICLIMCYMLFFN